MKKLRFTFSGTSHNNLQKFADSIMKAAKETGVVKAGPVCFKNKKLIDIYYPSKRTIDRLMVIKTPKGLSILVEDLSNQYSMQA